MMVDISNEFRDIVDVSKLSLEDIKREIKRLYAEVRMKNERIEDLIVQWEDIEKIKELKDEA